MTDPTPNPTPEPNLTADQRINFALRRIADAADAFASLGHDQTVDADMRLHFRRDAVRLADMAMTWFPNDALEDAGQLARDWMDIRGQEPTGDQVFNVYMAALRYLIPREPPLTADGQTDA
jgi:hypothetical protein